MRFAIARLPRLVVVGQPHLVILRGRQGVQVFVDDIDRRLYVDALIAAASDASIALHAYALLDDRVCLLATPKSADALGRFMQRVGRRYVGGFNRRHGQRGTPWAGRFQAAAIDPEHYLLPAICFIEQAPVRAGHATAAHEWSWSSAAHHGGRKRSSWIVEHPAYWQLGNTPFEREARHELALQALLTDVQVDALTQAVRGGWPLGSPAFVATVSQSTERRLQPLPRGRPRSSGGTDDF